MPINFEEMKEEIVSDIMEQFEYSEEDARRFANMYTSSIIDEMWTRYYDELIYHEEAYEPYEPAIRVGGE